MVCSLYSRLFTDLLLEKEKEGPRVGSIFTRYVTASLPESIMETCSVVLTFQSMDKILWCDHSNKTSSAVLLHDTICLLIF